MFTIIPASRTNYRVAFYGARDNKAFDCWESNPMSYGRAVALRLRLMRTVKRATAQRMAQKAVLAGWTGVRVDTLGTVWGYEPGQTEDVLTNAAAR